MFQPVEIENPNALEDAKVDSLQDRNLTDGIVGPAMLPTETAEETKSSAKSGKKKDRQISYRRYR